MHFLFRPERKVLLIISMVAFMGLGLLGYRAVYATGDRVAVVAHSNGREENRGDRTKEVSGMGKSPGRPESFRSDESAEMDESSGASDIAGACETAKIVVHVCGEVKRPGVYSLANSARVNDAVNAAGGATDSACLDAVNLASPISDGQQVYIPPKPKPQRSQSFSSAAIGKPSGSAKTGSFTAVGSPKATDGGVDAVPRLGGAASQPDGHTAQSGDVVGARLSEQGAVADSLQLADPLQGGSTVININTSNKEELMKLKGVGPVLAERIIEYRTRNGRFSAIEDLLDVPGIGPKKLEAMRQYITVY
ncbi:MAG TPA: hypothetical protein GX509_11350 [Firmicutes bacterium]|nr:hypothetical protein [Bacillota bacterium]